MRPRSLAFWLSQMRMTWQQRFSNSHYSPFPPCKRSRARTWEIDRGGGIFTHFQIRHHDHTTKTEAAIQLRGPNLRSSFPFSFSISWSKTNASSLRSRGKKHTPSFPHMSKEDTYPGRPEQDLPLAQKKEDISFLFLPPRIQSGHVNAEEEETFSKQASRALSPFLPRGSPSALLRPTLLFLSRRMNTQEIKK